MQQLNTDINNCEVDKIGLFVQKNQKYYKEKFKTMEEKGKSKSWNWAAFFMGIHWMIYRKMYFKAIAFYILGVIAVNTPYIGGVLYICYLVGLGMYSNALYQDHVDVNIKKLSLISSEFKEKYISKKGGTNLAIATGIFLIQNIIATIMLNLF